MAPVLDEQSRRRFVALEAKALGRDRGQFDGSNYRAGALYDLSRTIRDKDRPRRDVFARARRSRYRIQTSWLPPKSLSSPQPGVIRHSWTSRSWCNLVKDLAQKGHTLSPTVVGDLLRDMGYGLQILNELNELIFENDGARRHRKVASTPSRLSSTSAFSPGLPASSHINPCSKTVASGFHRALHRFQIRGEVI
jgi:hypothetical protein